MAALVPLHSWGVIAARNSFSHSRSRQRWKIRLSSRHALWYWQINSLQGPQKRGLVIHVSPSFLLSVNLLTNLLMGPGTESAVGFHSFGFLIRRFFSQFARLAGEEL